MLFDIEKSLPKDVKIKLKTDPMSVPKYASYFPLWQIHPKFQKSHKKLENQKLKLNYERMYKCK